MQYSELYPVYQLADSLGVSMTALMDGKHWYLFHIERTTGTPGAGAEVMRAFVAAARKHKAIVTLDCHADLQVYYAQFGLHIVEVEGVVTRMSTKKGRSRSHALSLAVSNSD